MISAHRDDIKGWLEEDKLTLVKVHDLLASPGWWRLIALCTVSPHQSWGSAGLGRRCGWPDPEPGRELTVDCERLGLLLDPAAGRRRVVSGLTSAAVYSRHMIVWPTHSQTLGR